MSRTGETPPGSGLDPGRTSPYCGYRPALEISPDCQSDSQRHFDFAFLFLVRPLLSFLFLFFSVILVGLLLDLQEECSPSAKLSHAHGSTSKDRARRLRPSPSPNNSHHLRDRSTATMTQDRSPSPVKRQDEKESAASAKLQSNLAELASSGGITGAIASTLVSSYEAFEDEITKRGQMIGGIDQLWLLLENATDFNPVCAATYTYKGKMTKEKAIAVRLQPCPRLRHLLTFLSLPDL